MCGWMCSKCLELLQALETNHLITTFDLADGNFASRVDRSVEEILARNREEQSDGHTRTAKRPATTTAADHMHMSP